MIHRVKTEHYVVTEVQDSTQDVHQAVQSANGNGWSPLARTRRDELQQTHSINTVCDRVQDTPAMAGHTRAPQNRGCSIQ